MVVFFMLYMDLSQEKPFFFIYLYIRENPVHMIYQKPIISLNHRKEVPVHVLLNISYYTQVLNLAIRPFCIKSREYKSTITIFCCCNFLEFKTVWKIKARLKNLWGMPLAILRKIIPHVYLGIYSTWVGKCLYTCI